MKLQKSNSGFTLLEILIAMAILAMSLVAIVSNQIQAVQLYDSTKNISIATQLAKQKMGELILEFKGKDVGEIPEEKKGDFKDTDFEEFKWNMTFKSDEEFKKIGSAIAAGSNQSSNAKDDINKMLAEQLSAAGLDPNMISELLGNAVKKLTITIEWTTELDEGEVSVWQHYIDDKAQMPGQNIGPAGPGTGGVEGETGTKTNPGGKPASGDPPAEPGDAD